MKTARPDTGYGMTETCGIITSIAGDFFVDRPASGRPGDAQLRSQMRGRCGPHRAARRGRRAVGARRPGDQGLSQPPRGHRRKHHRRLAPHRRLARVDEDGFVFIVDRKKDMVLRGGENVYCAEVEAGDPPPSSRGRMLRVRRARRAAGRGGRGGRGAARRATRSRPTSCASTALRTSPKHKIPRYIWLLDEPCRATRTANSSSASCGTR